MSNAPRKKMGGGTNDCLVPEMSGDPGSIRQEVEELSRNDPTGIGIDLVSSTNGDQAFEIVS